MIIEYLRLNNQVKDSDFDMIYPPTLRKMSGRHFTRIAVARKAAQLLATGPDQKILDIGSGAGKFCFVGSSCTNISYTGVDYRKHFIELCDKLVAKHRVKNVEFIHANITDIDFSKYDGFYFFNSFQEQTDQTAKIDDTVDVNQQNFKKYSNFLREQFERLPTGTRIVTYHARRSQIPDSYQLVSAHFDELLKCWQKT